jgi:predicted O-methyltransferase YrrM
MTKLNTGWKHWDKYLSKFVGKKINCLDIGSFEGDSTCWMLKNLCTNPYSRVYSVDTWEGGSGYTENTVFSEVEKKFDKNVEKTGKTNQNIKLKMLSSQALIKLRSEGNIFFDFIFIDASHEAKDVLSDAILSWDMLVENGIMIFDDYKWEKLNKQYFHPKVAVDSFIYIFKPQLKTLYVGWQYIIEKINKRDFEKPELNDLYKLIDDINFFKFDKIDEVFEDDEFGEIKDKELKFKLVMSKQKPEYLTKEIKDYFSYLKQLNEKYPRIIIYTFLQLLNTKNPIEIIRESIKDKIKSNTELLIDSMNYSQFLSDKTQSFNIFNLVDNYCKNNPNKDINLFFIVREEFKIQNNIKNYINKKYNIKTNLDHFGIYNNDINYNFDSIKNIINNKKYEILLFRNCVNRVISVYNLIIKQSFNLNIELFYRIYLCLALQKENGNALFGLTLDFTETHIQFIYLLKKYYKRVILTSSYKYYYIGFGLTVECYDFIGINKKDLDDLKNVAEKISKNNNDYIQNSKFLESFIQIDKKYYELIKKKIIIYCKKKIYKSLKYFAILEKIEDYVHDKNNDIKNINYLKNTVYKKQISEFIYILYSLK